MALIEGTTAVPQSVAKLIDSVGNQLGLFLEPTHIRRKGRAQADVLVSEANAKAEIAVLEINSKLAIQNIQDRAAEKNRRREEKRQANAEAIAGKAVRELPPTASGAPVDEDWVAQFLDHCQDVSNEQMQSVWAKILAGEVTAPGSFSLRTLAAVKLLSPNEANAFTRFCSLLWETNDGPLLIVPDTHVLASLPGIQLPFLDLFRLDSLDLIRLEGAAGFSLRFEADAYLNYSYYGKPHIMTHKGACNLRLGGAMLTDVGRELVPIAGGTPNEGYRRWVIKDLRDQGWEVVEAPIDAAASAPAAPGNLPGCGSETS
jgi:hypothetical protein